MNTLGENTALQIASGQVIINLASVVKELLENALDAGATSIEIRLQNSGAHCIEVSDNGHGIVQNDFNMLCKRNHTSKLSTIDELASVASFGFRGEALSSLCALSEQLCITTRHTTSAYAHRLEFDGSGRIVKQTKQARTPGTTVQVRGLFHTIPVRRREFTTNSRLELSRMLNMLYAYAVGVQNVKLLCTNAQERSGNSVLLQSFGNAKLSENIAAVFGQPMLTNLIEFKQSSTTTSAPIALPNELCEEFSLSVEEVTKNNDMFQISGLVSSCEHGGGQNTRDRQYLFLNRRPSKIPSLTNVINQTYRQFNAQQYPFVALNISAPREDIDINVTPSKNEVLLKKERLLLYYVKSSLLEMYNSMPLNLRYSRPNAVMNFAGGQRHAANVGGKNDAETLPVSTTKQAQLPAEWRTLASVVSSPMRANEAQSLPVQSPPRQQTAPSRASPERRTPRKSNNSSLTDNTAWPYWNNLAGNERTPSIDNSLTGFSVNKSPAKSNSPKKRHRSGGTATSSNHTFNTDRQIEPTVANNFSNAVFNSSTNYAESSGAGDLISVARRSPSVFASDNPYMARAAQAIGVSMPNVRDVEPTNTNSALINAASSSHAPKRLPSVIYDGNKQPDVAAVGASDDSSTGKPLGKLRLIQKPTTIPIRTDILLKCNGIKTLPMRSTSKLIDSPVACTQSSAALAVVDDDAEIVAAAADDDSADCHFDAQITPSQNDKAEQELRCFVKPFDFTKMQILGQFNRGFILACLNNEHVFIIDQHASDERHQLELLQRNPRLEGQQLLQPQPLASLTTADELLIRHRLDMLEKFGFVFANTGGGSETVVAGSGESMGKRLMLVKAPVFEGNVLGCDDVRDIVTLLLDPVACTSGGSGDRDPLPRYPPKLERLFANRACKRAVKIGMHLKVDEMRRVVRQLAECREPWKCAHGRPTVRHLMALSHMKQSAGSGKSDEFSKALIDAEEMPTMQVADSSTAPTADFAVEQKKDTSSTFYAENIVRAQTCFDSTYFTSLTTLRVKGLLYSAD